MPGWRGPEPRVAVRQQLLVAHVVRERAALVGGGADPQQVSDVVEHVGAHHLPEEVVADRLEAGEAAAPAGVAGVGRRRPVHLRARVVVDRAPAVVEALEQLAQRLRGGGGVGGQAAQLVAARPCPRAAPGWRARRRCPARAARAGPWWRTGRGGRARSPGPAPRAGGRPAAARTRRPARPGAPATAAARPGTRACGAPTRARRRAARPRSRPGRRPRSRTGGRRGGTRPAR